MSPANKGCQKINDLIFKELIKRGYSLEGNTRIWNIADSKLWYLTPKQSQAFLDLEQSTAYQKEIIQKEIDLINKNLCEILAKVGKDYDKVDEIRAVLKAQGIVVKDLKDSVDWAWEE